MLKQRIICSLVAEYFKKEKYLYSLSVFVPETGFSGNILSHPELAQIFKVKQNEEKALLDFLISRLLDDSLGGSRKVKEVEIQTDDIEKKLTLEQKLSKIDSECMAGERFPYKDLEERMLKYKNDLEDRMKRELAAKITHLKEVEVAAVRVEGAAKYRAKIEEYKNQLEQMHNEKVAELRKKEMEVRERCKLEEQKLEKANYDHRQIILKDMETIRLREKEIKKDLESRLNDLDQEKINLKELQTTYEQRMRDAERMREKLNEEIHSKIEE